MGGGTGWGTGGADWMEVGGASGGFHRLLLNLCIDCAASYGAAPVSTGILTGGDSESHCRPVTFLGEHPSCCCGSCSKQLAILLLQFLWDQAVQDWAAQL